MCLCDMIMLKIVAHQHRNTVDESDLFKTLNPLCVPCFHNLPIPCLWSNMNQNSREIDSVDWRYFLAGNEFKAILVMASWSVLVTFSTTLKIIAKKMLKMKYLPLHH